MDEYEFLAVSDGNGDAPLMHITAPRLTGADTIAVDVVTNVPTKFIATYGTLDANGKITAASKCDFFGHLSGGNLIIDAFCAGSTDAGNAEGDVVIIKPNSDWSNLVAQFLANATANGTPQAVTFANTVVDILTSDSIVNAGSYAQAGGTFTVPDNSINQRAINNPYKFYAYQSVETGGAVSGSKIPIGTELFDTNNNFDTTNYRYTVPVSGFYWIGCNVTVYEDDASTAWQAGVKKNGTTYVITSDIFVDMYAPAYDMGLTAGNIIQLTAGDYLELFLIQGHASGSTVRATYLATYMSGFLVSQI